MSYADIDDADHNPANSQCYKNSTKYMSHIAFFCGGEGQFKGGKEQSPQVFSAGKFLKATWSWMNTN